MATLSERLQQHTPEILRRWEAKVRTAVPAARRESRPVLLNSIPIFLEELALALSGSSKGDVDQRRAPLEHAEQRARLPKYSLDQVIEEYALLRGAILEALSADGPIGLADINVVLDTIDVAVIEATTHYVGLQEQQLRESEQRFRLLVNGVRDYAIFMLDADGNVVSWNEGAERIKGYAADEIVGKHFSRFYPDEDVRAGKCERGLRIARDEGRWEDEGWRVRKDGSRFFAHVIISALRDENGRVRGFAKVTRDVTERRAMEEELRRRTEELGVANRRKDEFLAVLAHELRNPLAPIQNSCESLLKSVTDPRQRRALDIIQRQTMHLTRLVDDLLDIGRITRGRIELQKERVELRALIAGVVSAVRSIIDERQQILTQSLPDEDVWLDADPTRLSQVLMNILHNSIKFTERGGRIQLRARIDGSDAVIQVQDSGRGIEATLLPHIFDLFAQGSQTAPHLTTGLGVGLALVRQLVELHGGVVSASSGGYGQGSTFEVRLPYAEGAPAQKSFAAPEVNGPSNLRALVVDDNTDAAMSVAALLELDGHQVRIVHRGAEALDAARKHQPHFILLDIGLPDVDGYEVARRVRADPAVGNVCLIALSGYGRDDDRRRTREAGFNAHLTKPADAQRLRSTLADCQPR